MPAGIVPTSAKPRRLLLSDATLYDPNSRLTSASQDASTGKITATLTGGWASDDPKATVCWQWPIRNVLGARPNELLAYAQQVVLREFGYPSQKFSGDTWIVAGIGMYGNPTSSWSARGYGWRYVSSAGARRGRACRMDAGTNTNTDSSTSQTNMRAIDMVFGRPAWTQRVLPLAAVVLDGVGNATGTDVFTTNVATAMGTGQLCIFVAIGRNNAANVTADTLYFQVDAHPVVPSAKQLGLMDASRVLNVFPLGDSITQGTGWNYDSNGELFGWRRKLEDLWIATPGLPVLQFHGGNGTSHAAMLLGRNHHEGHSGFTTANISAALAGYLNALTTPQDVVILALGTNDAQAAVATNTVISNLQSIITTVRAHSNFASGGKLILSGIPRISNSTHEAQAAAYRAQLGTLTGVDGTIDDWTNYDVSGADSADGVHPNSSGYDKFAASRLAAIRLARGI